MAKRTRAKTDRGTFLRAQVKYTEAARAELGDERSSQLDRLAHIAEAGGADFAARELERLAATSGLPEGSLGRSRIEHQAGVAFRFVIGGAGTDALEKARTLLERAYNSKARKRYARAHGETALHLAHCYRDIGRTLAVTGREAAWSTSERLLEEALSAMEKLGLPGAFHAASTLQSIANLAGEAGDVKKARRFNKAARELVERRVDALGWKDETFPNPQGLYATIVANSTTSALQERRVDGLRCVRAELEAALQRVDDPRLRLRLAQVNSVLGILDQRNLDALASERVLTTLPLHDLDSVPVLLAEGSRTNAVDAFFHMVTEHLVQVRSDQYANHASDHTAGRLQHFARYWAKLVAKDDAALAFCIVEMNACLRMQEAVRFHQWQPKDASTAADFEEWTARAGLASAFEQWSALLTGFPEEARASVFAAIERQLAPGAVADPEMADHVGPESIERLQAEFRRLDRSLPPEQALSMHAEVLDDEATTMREKLEEDAAFLRAHSSLHPIDPDELFALLREVKGTAFLRMELLHDEVLAFYADIDGNGKERVIVYPVPVPTDIASLDLRGLWENGHLSDVVTRALDTMDLLGGVPDDAPRRVIVLQSGMLALLPTLAIGPPGRTLLDRFDAIQNLWSLDALRVRPPENERAGTLALYPGRDAPIGAKNVTFFHAIASSAAPGPAVDEIGRLTPLDAVVAAWSRARFVSFYGHGAHIPMGSRRGEVGPQLVLDTGELLGMRSLQRTTLGVERVELWACQSGLDFPWDPMFPMGDGFGLDYELIRAGVRSTIGTLWSVDELVTSFIVLRFRIGLAEEKDGARALADAQRWWRDVARPRLMASVDIIATVGELWRDLIGRDAGDSLRRICVLLLTKRGDPETWRSLTNALTSPTAHAAYRFSGLVHRPLGVPPTPRKPSPGADSTTTPEPRRLSLTELASFPVIRRHGPVFTEIGAFYDEVTDLLAVITHDRQDDDFGYIILARASPETSFRSESADVSFVSQAKAEAASIDTLVARRQSKSP